MQNRKHILISLTAILTSIMLSAAALPHRNRIVRKPSQRRRLRRRQPRRKLLLKLCRTAHMCRQCLPYREVRER